MMLQFASTLLCPAGRHVWGEVHTVSCSVESKVPSLPARDGSAGLTLRGAW
ncbi:uncharacterized protein PgNI_04724 [Pyricularia grisea]|uniref:Uncharacterized protein n=1 Tax=Pyricularia grisea TaxID=148305 RepID=A0A6P8B8J4_PYRGI|nr:uncharacterized protein PgNI_04724 [Pyricularia grisea]TLD12165.1 hypothetical protein PgNI_04724 [Pyricularia grisea]